MVLALSWGVDGCLDPSTGIVVLATPSAQHYLWCLDCWRSLTDWMRHAHDDMAYRSFVTQDVLLNCMFFLPLMAQVTRAGLLHAS